MESSTINRREYTSITYMDYNARWDKVILVMVETS